jgi:hypothetical protein
MGDSGRGLWTTDHLRVAATKAFKHLAPLPMQVDPGRPPTRPGPLLPQPIRRTSSPDMAPRRTLLVWKSADHVISGIQTR